MRTTRKPGRAILAIALVAFCGSLPAGQEPPGAWVEAIGTPQYFAVLVEDVDRSVRWYRTAFGLTEVDRSQAEDASWQIVNLKSDALWVEIIRDQRAQSADRARGFGKVGFWVPDVRVVADRVAAATGDRPRVLEFAAHGIRIVQVRDPDGNVIQLASPLSEERE